MNTEKSNLKTLTRILALALVTTFISGQSSAVAANSAISTSSTIENGAFEPSPIIQGVGFASDSDKFNFSVNVGKTQLAFDSVAYVNSTHLRFNFHGVAKKGTITISAKSSAFISSSQSSGNVLEIDVAAPLVIQTIDFKSLVSAEVGEADQFAVASSSSGLAVEFMSSTPTVCTIYYSKIHAVAAGTCSIEAIQSGDDTYAPAVSVVKTFAVLAAPSLVGNVSSDEILIPVDLGVVNYNPSAINDSNVSFLLLGSDNGTENATLVKLVIPNESTDVNAAFLTSAVSTSQEASDGYFVTKVKAVNGHGTEIENLNKVIEINIPAGAKGSQPSWSSDGLTWLKLQKLESDLLPTNLQSGYFVDSDGRYAILTNQLGFFGNRNGQSSLRSGSAVAMLKSTAKVILSSNASSGTGSMGLTVASVTKSTCNLLSYSLSKSSTSVQAAFCPQDAGKIATLYVKSISTAKKAIDKKIASALIDSNGNAVFYVSSEISKSNFLEIFVGGTRRI